jgi:hypothetical protein
MEFYRDAIELLIVNPGRELAKLVDHPGELNETPFVFLDKLTRDYREPDDGLLRPVA